jgi:hypothetical protein
VDMTSNPDVVTTQALDQWTIVANSSWVTPRTVRLNSLRLGNYAIVFYG